MTRTKEDDGETKNGKKKSWIPSYVSTYTYKHLYYTRGEGGEQLYIYQDLHESKGKVPSPIGVVALLTQQPFKGPHIFHQNHDFYFVPLCDLL